LLESILLMLSMGLLGSLHCIGMCGGLVSAVAMSRPTIWWPGLFGYQIGRVTTYTLFGLIAGLFGTALGHIGGWPMLRALAVIAGVLMIVFGLNLAGWLPDPLRRFTATISQRIGLAKLAHRLAGQASLSGWYVMGLANGLLPCGLVYAALGLSLASGDTASAVSMMFFFGIGTIPSMMFAPSLIRKLTPELRGWSLRIAGVIVIVLGVMTTMRDGSMHGQHGAMVHDGVILDQTMPDQPIRDGAHHSM
jgi:sulfite exporter TauE/SafE